MAQYNYLLCCEQVGCYNEFKTFEERKAHYQGAIHEDEPITIAEMRELRSKAEAWVLKSCGVPMMEAMEKVISQIHSSIVRDYLNDQGLSNKHPEEVDSYLLIECTSPEENMKRYNVSLHWCTELQQEIRIRKNMTWWIMVLHLEERCARRYISDTVHNAEVSHICHWCNCLASAHVEPVNKSINTDRSICKSGIWQYYERLLIERKSIEASWSMHPGSSIVNQVCTD